MVEERSLLSNDDVIFSRRASFSEMNRVKLSVKPFLGIDSIFQRDGTIQDGDSRFLLISFI